MAQGIVAIVGRPNVGKSTLFNRLVGERVAIVEDLPGTTRDRIYGDAEWSGRTFTVIDTGGLEVFPTSEVSDLVRAQVEIAIDEADVILFLVDLKDGVTAVDLDIADLLRASGKPVVLGANKAESTRLQETAYELYELGLGEPITISGLHGMGTGDLLDAIIELLPASEFKEEEQAGLIKIAISGRPNVGKSSVLNRIFGQERTIVSEVPGTTRDAIDTYLKWEDRSIMLIDTAGIRRRGRIEVGVEQYSVMRALRAINRADVVALIIDADEGFTAQDAHVAGYIRDAYKGMAVVVNKWDLIEDKTTQTAIDYTRAIQAELKFMPYVPILFVSAKTGQRINRILPELIKIYDERQQRVPTAQLNRIIEDAVIEHPPPSRRGRRLKILYATQVGVNPPSFVFFVNDSRLLHFSYERYLENRLRENYGFLGTPIRLTFRSRGEEAVVGAQ